MKVSSAAPQTASAAGGAPRAAGDGFNRLLDVAQAGPKTALAGVGPASALRGLDALMALQGAIDPEARGRALRKGRRMLEALDRLQASLLGAGPTQGDLQQLDRALQDQRAASGDPLLDETLHWAEVRCAVERAKLERAAA